MSIAVPNVESCKSTFTLTFAIEIVGLDVWHDCNEGWLDLGPPVQGMKIQYQLYLGANYDLDVLIWPHAAKVFCGNNSGWVRTWQFLERRWIAFSISHILTVRVNHFQNHVVTIYRTMGLGAISANAKADKTLEVYLPRLEFGQRRYFAPVLERSEKEQLAQYVQKLLWNSVIELIPKTIFDDKFDVPSEVTDVRHQDAVIYHVQDRILNTKYPEEPPPPIPESETQIFRARYSKSIGKNDTKVKMDPKIKEKKKVDKVEPKFEIKLSGDAIIAGTGRITLFEEVGEPPLDLAKLIVFISSNNLPAEDDNPVVFVNIGKITDIPLNGFIKQNITHIYARWCLSDKEHVSEIKEVNKTISSEIDFNDHHTIILPFATASDIVTVFMDGYYRIEIRGLRQTQTIIEPSFFGYVKGDNDFGKIKASKIPDFDTDFLICETRIDARSLLKNQNAFIRGDYPLYPPEVSAEQSVREQVCTNDVNAVRAPVKPYLVVQPAVILEAQMTLEVSMGVVGCLSRNTSRKYSRLFCTVRDSEAISAVLRVIEDTNDKLLNKELRDELLTGYCIDTGDEVLLYIEGPRDGKILRIWMYITNELYPQVKPIFSTADKYRCRLYPELLLAPSPFKISKMYAPLSLILACPSIYARPAIPLPAKSALLKIDRLLSCEKYSDTLLSYDKMPSAVELESFKLELCVAPRPPPIELHVSHSRSDTQKDHPPRNQLSFISVHSTSKVFRESNKR